MLLHAQRVGSLVFQCQSAYTVECLTVVGTLQAPPTDVAICPIQPYEMTRLLLSYTPAHKTFQQGSRLLLGRMLAGL